jgi:hypothetical protein
VQTFAPTFVQHETDVGGPAYLQGGGQRVVDILRCGAEHAGSVVVATRRPGTSTLFDLMSGAECEHHVAKAGQALGEADMSVRLAQSLWKNRTAGSCKLLPVARRKGLGGRS